MNKLKTSVLSLALSWTSLTAHGEPVLLQTVTTNNSIGPRPVFTKSSRIAFEQFENTVLSRDADGNGLQVSRVLKRHDGATLATRASRVVQVAPGANTFDAASQTWNPAEETLAIVDSGVDGGFGNYSLHLAGNCNSSGAVEVTLADGSVLRSHVLGIYYFDAKTGKSVLIAQLKDSVGAVTPKRDVVYADAFDGVRADLVYRSSPAAFEQDVLWRGKPGRDPASLGLDPETTFVEVVTEFLGYAQPAILERVQESIDAVRGVSVPEQQISFGSMRLAPGRTFGTGFKSKDGKAVRMYIPVFKRWTVTSNRRLLIEATPYSQLKKLSDKLPFASAPRASYAVTADRILPGAPATRGTTTVGTVKFDPYAQPGLVLDYVLVPNTNPGGYPYTFQSGQTYLVNGNVWLQSGATFQANAVIKFARGATLTVSGSLNCPANGTGKCILTAIDDHTAGEKLSDQPVAGTYAAIALSVYTWNGPKYVQNLDIRYAEQAMQFYVSSSAYVTDVNVVRCTTPVSAYHTTVWCSGGTWCDTGTFYNYGSSQLIGGPAVTLVGTADNDGDLLGNIDELTRTKTDPLNAYSRSATKKDGEFMLTADGGNDSNAHLEIVYAIYHSAQDYTEVKLRVSNTPLDYTWDVFFAPLLNPNAWQLVWSGLPQIGWGTSTHEYMFNVPGYSQGYFQVFGHEDSDYDGVPDGYEIAVLKTVTGNPDSDSTRDADADGNPDYPGLGGNGIADGDEDFDGDGLTTTYELQIGTNPLVAQNNAIDSDGDGLPDWVESLITYWTGDRNPTPTGDSDGDSLDNATEWRMRTDPSGYDPVLSDLSGFPDYQRVVLQANFQLAAPSGAGFGEGGGFIDPEAYFDMSLSGIHGGAAHFSVFKDQADDGTPTPGVDRFVFSGGFQTPPDPTWMQNAPSPDPSDGSLDWEDILTQATSLVGSVWENAKVAEKMTQLTESSLVHLQYRSVQRIAVQFRVVQLMQVAQAIPDGLLLRTRYALSVIHTEATILRSATLQIGLRFPGHDAFARFGRFLPWAGAFCSVLSAADTAKNDVLPAFETYLNDVLRHCDNAADSALDLAYALAVMADNAFPGIVLTDGWSWWWISLSNYDGWDTNC